MLLLAFALVLCVGGYVSALFSLEPFMADGKRYFLALAIAGVLPFAVHYVINQYRSERLVRRLAVSAFISACIAMGSLTLIRSQVLAEQMKQANAAIVIDGETAITVDQRSAPAARVMGRLRRLPRTAPMTPAA
jgi:predicted PurR-regulated permease PerM